MLKSCIHAQSHELLQQWADTITREEVNTLAATYLSYISHYRAEEELLQAVKRGEGDFAVPPGPVRMTAIVACLPAFTDPSGQSSGESFSSTLHWGSACCPAEYIYAGAVLDMCRSHAVLDSWQSDRRCSTFYFKIAKCARVHCM